VEAVGRVSPFTRAYLLELRPVGFANNTLLIGYTPDFSDRLGLVDNARTHQLLQTALREAGHQNVHIKFVKTSAATAPTAPPAEAAPATPPAAATPAAPGSTEPAAAASPGRATAAPLSGEDDFKNDPLIRRALEIFRGQIVSVRA
jgi:hypothetical protein